MIIERLEVENFKKFTGLRFDLNPRFTLLVGNNGSGKTTILDALAVALGLWHDAAPRSGWRNILTEEIRVEPVDAGDRLFWKLAQPTRITAWGVIGQQVGLKWSRVVRKGRTRTVNEAREAKQAIRELMRAAECRQGLLPVLAYYGAGRAWQPTNKRSASKISHQIPMQFDAYRNCLDARIREQDLNEWFLLETAAADRGSDGRPGFRAVKMAIQRCVPGADRVWYDVDLKQIILSIGGYQQPFSNLSAGQRMMLAMIADIAIKAVTLNSYLLGPGELGAEDPKQVLQRSPGVVLIDELDVHLHPTWQRHVARDLKETFPAVQFICTSHSPQVIGEVKPDEIRILDQQVITPNRSFGIDSSRILEELMSAKPRNEVVEESLKKLFDAIEDEDFASARRLLPVIEAQIGGDDPELTRARALMKFLEPSA